MDGINQLDLITQRVLALQVKTLTEELAGVTAQNEQTRADLAQALQRITELEAPPAETKVE